MTEIEMLLHYRDCLRGPEHKWVIGTRNKRIVCRYYHCYAMANLTDAQLEVWRTVPDVMFVDRIETLGTDYWL